MNYYMPCQVQVDSNDVGTYLDHFYFTHQLLSYLAFHVEQN